MTESTTDHEIILVVPKGRVPVEASVGAVVAAGRAVAREERGLAVVAAKGVLEAVTAVAQDVLKVFVAVARDGPKVFVTAARGVTKVIAAVALGVPKVIVAAAQDVLKIVAALAQAVVKGGREASTAEVEHHQGGVEAEKGQKVGSEVAVVKALALSSLDEVRVETKSMSEKVKALKERGKVVVAAVSVQRANKGALHGIREAVTGIVQMMASLMKEIKEARRRPPV